MERSALITTTLLLLVASVATAQAPAQVPQSCEIAAVEVSVWRGTQSTPDVASVPEQICASDSAAMSDPSPAATPADVPMPMGWGVPGLEEITALVLSAPEVRDLSAPPPADPEQPEVILGADVAGTSMAQSARFQTVIVTTGEDGEAEQILHLRVLEVSPGVVDVTVHAGAAAPVRLVWRRPPGTTQWSPA